MIKRLEEDALPVLKDKFRSLLSSCMGKLPSILVNKCVEDMNTLREIESAIKQLPENDIRQLAAWLEDYLEQRWDHQIQADLVLGKLDKLIAKAEADITGKRVRDLDEIICDT